MDGPIWQDRKRPFFHPMNFLKLSGSSQNLIPILEKSFIEKLLISNIYHNVLLFTSKVSSLTTRIRTNEMVGSCLLAWTRCGRFRRSSQLLRFYFSPIRSTHTVNLSFYYPNNLSPIVLAHQRLLEGMTSIKIAIPTLLWWTAEAGYAEVFWFRNDSFWQQLVSLNKITQESSSTLRH